MKTTIYYAILDLETNELITSGTNEGMEVVELFLTKDDALYIIEEVLENKKTKLVTFELPYKTEIC